MKPFIGLPAHEDNLKGYQSTNNNYVNSVLDAGGIPVIIPTLKEEEDFNQFLNILDGIIFTGGVDISPLNYDENPVGQIHRISSERDEFEFTLFRKAYEMKLPILGVCRGMHLMNVALGGKLYQDINSQVPGVLGHNPQSTTSDEYYHSINNIEGTEFYDIFNKEKIYVNSYHHQGIKKLGRDLKVSALSEDGIIEAVEGINNRFLIGVQFHPEALQRRHTEFRELFEALIEASSEAKKENLQLISEVFA